VLEQSWVLSSVQKILVDSLGAETGDHLALLQLAAHPHGKARYRCSLGQDNLKTPFPSSRLRIAERQVELREDQGVFDHCARLVADELQARPVRRSERDRRTLQAFRPVLKAQTRRGADRGLCPRGLWLPLARQRGGDEPHGQPHSHSPFRRAQRVPLAAPPEEHAR